MNFTIDPIWTALFATIAMFVGKKLKDKPDFKNRWIPIITLVITAIGQMMAAATASAFNLGHVLHAAISGTTILTSFIVWLTTTGAFSVGKNTLAGKTSDPH